MSSVIFLLSSTEAIQRNQPFQDHVAISLISVSNNTWSQIEFLIRYYLHDDIRDKQFKTSYLCSPHRTLSSKWTDIINFKTTKRY